MTLQQHERNDLDTLTTTATHVFTLRQMQWVRREAKRTGKSMSEIVRACVDAAMAKETVAA